jgi:hypothetical protein
MATLDEYRQAMEQKQAQTEQAQSNYLKMTPGMYTISDSITNNLKERYGYNKDLIDQSNKAWADYFAAPAKYREKYSNIANPFTREKLASQERANLLTNATGTEELKQNRVGRFGEIIQSTGNAYQAETERARGGFEMAQTALQNAITNYQRAYQEEMQRRAEEYQRQMLELQKQAASFSSGGGGYSGGGEAASGGGENYSVGSEQVQAPPPPQQQERDLAQKIFKMAYPRLGG